MSSLLCPKTEGKFSNGNGKTFICFDTSFCERHSVGIRGEVDKPTIISSICSTHTSSTKRLRCEYLFGSGVTFQWCLETSAIYESHMLTAVTPYICIYTIYIYMYIRTYVYMCAYVLSGSSEGVLGQKLCFNLIWLWSPADADVVIVMTCTPPAYVQYMEIGNIRRRSRCRRSTSSSSSSTSQFVYGFHIVHQHKLCANCKRLASEIVWNTEEYTYIHIYIHAHIGADCNLNRSNFMKFSILTVQEFLSQ